ncbi:GlgB N-terminal domain-containing protein, partial [Aeromonas sp. HMWF014]
MLVERLVAARCADPFSHLGLQTNPDGPGLKLTVWLPDALEMRVRDLKSGKIVATLAPSDESGLFETVFTRRKNPFPYQLIADYADAKAEFVDPYQFQDAGWAGLAELTSQPDNIYHTLGAQLRTV